MPRRKFISGIIDPITIIGVLFLIVTLFIGTKVVNDRNISLNIQEKADCMSTCMREIGDSDECSSSCGATRPDVQVTAPEPEPDNEPIDNNLEEAEEEYIQENSGASPTVFTNTTPVQPSTEPEVSEQSPTNDNVQTCDANGAQYPEGSVVVYGGIGSYRKCIDGRWENNCSISAITPEICEITDLTPNFVPSYLQNQYNSEIQAQNYVGEVDNNLESEESAFIQGVIEQEQKTQAAIQTQISPTNTNPLANLSGFVGSGATPDVYKPKFESKAECQASVNPDSREYNACGQFATPEENKLALFNSLNSISFGAFSNYTSSFSPDKVEYYWQTSNYDSLEDCENDFVGRGKGYCSQIQYTKDQTSSSVQLGSIITAEAALLTTGFGYGAGTLTGADALTQGLAISTVYQSGTATSVRIDNPESSECKEAVAWAAISWANVGTAANILNLSAQSAQYLNTAVNIVNIGADIYDANQSCTGENASGLGCALSVGAGLLDVGGGVLDIADIVRNINTPTGLAQAISPIPANTIPSGNQVDVGVSQADNYIGTAPTNIADGGLGFSQNYTPNPPNQTSVQLANLLDQAGINPSFPSVTANNLLDTVANSSLTGNPFPTTLDTTDLANALDTPPANTGNIFDSIFSTQNGFIDSNEVNPLAKRLIANYENRFEVNSDQQFTKVLSKDVGLYEFQKNIAKAIQDRLDTIDIIKIANQAIDKVRQYVPVKMESNEDLLKYAGGQCIGGFCRSQIVISKSGGFLGFFQKQTSLLKPELVVFNSPPVNFKWDRAAVEKWATTVGHELGHAVDFLVWKPQISGRASKKDFLSWNVKTEVKQYSFNYVISAITDNPRAMKEIGPFLQRFGLKDPEAVLKFLKEL